MDTRTTTGTTILSAEGKVIDFKNNQFEKYKIARVPTETCDGILTFLDTLDLKWEEGKVRDTDVDYRARRSSIAWIDDEELKAFVWAQFVSANKSDPDWCFDIDSIEDIQYTVYKLSPTPDDSNPLAAQSGHYEWHNDMVQDVDAKPSKKCRKLSLSLVLNDDYAGGSFEVGHFHRGEILKTTMPLKKGDIIVFPSQMEHRVNPVLSGERKVIVAWAWGPLYK